MKKYQCHPSHHDSCPICGKDTLTFESIEMVDAYNGFFEAYCNNCDFSGRQWNKLQFDVWQKYVGKGQYEDMEDK